MSKFTIECPVCHRYASANDGFFANKKINCACGNVIDVRTDKMTSCRCHSCGNDVLFDQSKGKTAKCPVCHAVIQSADRTSSYAHFHCPTCHCQLEAAMSAQSYTCPVCDSQIDVAKKQQPTRCNQLRGRRRYAGLEASAHRFPDGHTAHCA